MIFTCLFLLWFVPVDGEIKIRIANRSNVPIEKVRVQFPSQTEEYGNIRPREVSEYRVVKESYRYAYIEAVVEGKRAVLQPIDYVGEKKLRSGSYTYELSINQKATSEYDRLKLACRKD